MSPDPVRPQASARYYFLRLLLFWLVLFTSFRILFLAFNPGITFHSPVTNLLLSLVAGFRLDLSTIAYLMLPSYLLWFLYSWTGRLIFHHLNRYYHYIILFGLIALYVGNIKMYHEWGVLLTYSVFDYLRHPGEVISFISYAELSALLVFFCLYFFTAVWSFRKWVIGFAPGALTLIPKIAFTITLPFVLGLMARGGWQLAPINESSAYFSETPFFNQVAINPFWYFIHSYLNKDPDKNLYHFMREKEADQRNANLFAVTDDLTPEILTTTRPNIIFIILESWTADIIESLGGEKGITPQFDSLRRNGVLFTQIYAAGSRTEHGLTSVLSGFPPPPRISIINIPGKSQKLSGINQVLQPEGYSSSFYYGGEVGFANMKSFILGSRFQKIVDKSGFSTEQLNSKWGAHDQYVFEKQLKDLGLQSQPFLSVLLTLSSHEPFEVPMNTPFSDDTEADKFRAAVFYADHCLGEYFRQARLQSWYDKTLFILVADHGHRLPQHTNTLRPKAKHIPLLFFGPVIKPEYRGRQITVVGNQNDIAATLLHQLQLPIKGFPRSKNLLNPTAKSFAYYVTNDVLGWVTPDQSLVYTFATKELWKSNSVTRDTIRDDSIFLDAKAYLQTHFQAYLGM